MKKIWCLLFLVTSLQARHQIIYMISPPRSLSTVFLQMMSNRGDFITFNEPSQYAQALLVGELQSDLERVFKPDSPKTFTEVKHIVLNAAQSKLVFVKEVGSAAENFLKDNNDFMRNPNVYFVFLIRNPHHTVLSFYKNAKTSNRKNNYPLNRFWMGYETLWNSFCIIKAHAINKPRIMLVEDLCNDPLNTVKAFCDHIGIPFAPETLTWKPAQAGQQLWHELKNDNATEYWHGHALRSTCFTKPVTYDVDEYGVPTFAEFSDKNERDVCKAVYEYNDQYYQKLVAECEYLSHNNK